MSAGRDPFPQQIRGMNPFCFRSGEWATILTVAPTPVHTANGPLIRECYLVRFEDGVTDFFAVEDSVAEYEFRDVPDA